MNVVLRSILTGLLLGIVQGITEWLPVSSSGHLVAIQVFIGYEPPLLFDGLLHVASALVVWFVVRRDMIRYLKAFLGGFASIRSKGFKKAFGTQDAMIGWYAIAALIPSFLVGFLLYRPLESLFSNLLAVGIAALVTSAILGLSYFFRRGRVTDMSFPRAVAMGVAQAVAIVPGISRSGSTISAGIFTGMDREIAAKFSLMLAIPSLLGATAFVLLKNLTDLEMDLEFVLTTFVGVITVIITGYLSVNLLLLVVRNGGLHLFAGYTLFFGICCITMSIVFGL